MFTAHNNRAAQHGFSHLRMAPNGTVIGFIEKADGKSMWPRLRTAVNQFLKMLSLEEGKDWPESENLCYDEFEILYAHVFEQQIMITTKTRHGDFDVTLEGDKTAEVYRSH